MSKNLRIDREADGKQELDYGKEELDKEGKKKSLKDRWKDLKKALDNQTAFYSLDDAIDDGEEDEEQPDMEEQPEEGVDEEMADESEDAPDEEVDSGEDSGELPEWLPEDVAIEGQDASPSGDLVADNEEAQDDEQPEEGEDEGSVEDMLREAGHSDAEIAHIVHGHTVPEQDEAKRAKAEAEYAGIDRDQMMHEKEMQIRDQEADIENKHNQRMKDVEYDRAQKESGMSDIELEHAKKMKDLEYQKAQAEASVNEAQLKAQHAQRMLDLEYENAKAQKALELQFKEKEMEMKLKHADEYAKAQHQSKMAQQKDDAKFKAQQKDAQRKEQAKKSKMKKSEDEADDLSKAAPKWSFNIKTQQFNHPEYGSLAVKPSDSGGFHMIHNGKMISHHDSHDGLRAGLTDYMKNYNSPIRVVDSAAQHTETPPVQGEAINHAPVKAAAPSVPKAKLEVAPIKENKDASSWTAGGSGRKYGTIGGDGIGEDKKK